jgi:anti-anti-sigma factor
VAAGVRIEICYLMEHNAWLVRLEGEHDLSTATRLRRTLGGLENGHAGIVVDLSPVEFIDSSTVNVLISERAAMEEAGNAFRLVLAPNSQPRRVADLLGLPAGFAGYSSVRDALAPPDHPRLGNVVWHPRNRPRRRSRFHGEGRRA